MFLLRFKLYRFLRRRPWLASYFLHQQLRFIFHKLQCARRIKAPLPCLSIAFAAVAVIQNNNDNTDEISRNERLHKELQEAKYYELTEKTPGKAREAYHHLLNTIHKYHKKGDISLKEWLRLTAVVFSHMAGVEFSAGEYGSAEKLYKEVLRRGVDGGLFTTESPEFIEISIRISVIYCALARFDEAELGFRYSIKKAMALKETLSDKDPISSKSNDAHSHSHIEAILPDTSEKLSENTLLEDAMALEGMGRDGLGRLLIGRFRSSEAVVEWRKAIELCQKLRLRYTRMAIDNEIAGDISSITKIMERLQ